MNDARTPEQLKQRIAELERQVALLEERWELNDEIDDLAEIAIRDRLPVDHTLRLVLPALCRRTGATLAFMRTYDESLALHDFVHAMGEDATLPMSGDAIAAAVDEASPIVREVTLPGDVRGSIVAQALDVAGEPFGAVAIVVPAVLDEAERERLTDLLDTFSEEIDNHLASIAVARKKTMLTAAMSEALRDPVLDAGLARALDVLRENIPFEDMILVFRHEDDVSGASLRYKVLKNRQIVHDSSVRDSVAPDAGDVDAFMRSNAFRLMTGDDEDVRERFGIRRFREEVMITGMRSARVIGRVIVTSRRGEFNTFDRDLLDRFADSLRQRIVDFNREWKGLSTGFPKDVCERLLHEEDYTEKYLSPREKTCAVMFADISGFTRLSEQVLVHPEAIGRLVDTWSARVVEILWETGGVFDKMVGDCVIGIWGPPFHEASAQDVCRRAAEAARQIREFTRSLTAHEALPELVGQPVDVATGLNYAPLFVGTFGPDADFTGFSSGMNNTARLQGQAKGGEILCMDTFVEAYGDDAAFGEDREAAVKNVAKPLRFRLLK
jgi:class 3 adenylate cyclase